MTTAISVEAKSVKAKFEQAVIAETENLRRFALKRTRDGAMAEDLVQDTMVLALSNRERFKMGTNIRAWLFTILKNAHLNQLRKDKGNCEYLDEMDTGTMSAAPAQESHMDLLDVKRRIAGLPSIQRDTIMVHTFESSSYEETARRCRCTLGTVKSRLSRARAALSSVEAHQLAA
jgi:RNA polymerase sigma-70 factor, ECF subfamily